LVGFAPVVEQATFKLVPALPDGMRASANRIENPVTETHGAFFKYECKKARYP
jgi:hypothetical protein